MIVFLIISFSILLSTITVAIFVACLGAWYSVYDEATWYAIPALALTGFWFIIFYVDYLFYMGYIAPYFLGR